MSRALSAAGVPCGHEQVFNADRAEWSDEARADSSWMAAAQLDRVDVPVVLLTRHPLSVVKSLVEIGFFAPWDEGNPTHGPLQTAFPGVYDWTAPQDRALHMWLCLTSVALARAEVVIRLDALDVNAFARLLGWAFADPVDAEWIIDAIPPCNRHEESRERTGVTHDSGWRGHSPSLAAEAVRLASVLGYEI